MLTPQLDLDFVRAQFPAFSESTLAGGSCMCAQVMDRLEIYFRQLKMQPYYPNAVTGEAGAWMDQAYTALAEWMNTSAKTVYLGPSTSQNTWTLAEACMSWLQLGDEIIVTNQDHEANSGPVIIRLFSRASGYHSGRSGPNLSACPNLVNSRLRKKTN